MCHLNAQHVIIGDDVEREGDAVLSFHMMPVMKTTGENTPNHGFGSFIRGVTLPSHTHTIQRELRRCKVG
jgi:hypothetical protein